MGTKIYLHTNQIAYKWFWTLENLTFFLHTDNNDVDQPAHLRSLINAFVIAFCKVCNMHNVKILAD